jgi:hypothetical protein
MKKLTFEKMTNRSNVLSILFVLIMSIGITSCSKSNDEPDPGPGPEPTPTQITVYNGGTYTLSRFRIIFLNSSREKLSEKDCGTLAPNDKASAKIPTAAKEYYMATYLYNKWFFSPYYDISYSSLTLSDAEIGEWSSN